MKKLLMATAISVMLVGTASASKFGPHLAWNMFTTKQTFTMAECAQHALNVLNGSGKGAVLDESGAYYPGIDFAVKILCDPQDSRVVIIVTVENDNNGAESGKIMNVISNAWDGVP